MIEGVFLNNILGVEKTFKYNTESIKIQEKGI